MFKKSESYFATFHGNEMERINFDPEHGCVRFQNCVYKFSVGSSFEDAFKIVQETSSPSTSTVKLQLWTFRAGHVRPCPHDFVFEHLIPEQLFSLSQTLKLCYDQGKLNFKIYELIVSPDKSLGWVDGVAVLDKEFGELVVDFSTDMGNGAHQPTKNPCFFLRTNKTDYYCAEFLQLAGFNPADTVESKAFILRIWFHDPSSQFFRTFAVDTYWDYWQIQKSFERAKIPIVLSRKFSVLCSDPPRLETCSTSTVLDIPSAVTPIRGFVESRASTMEETKCEHANISEQLTSLNKHVVNIETMIHTIYKQQVEYHNQTLETPVVLRTSTNTNVDTIATEPYNKRFNSDANNIQDVDGTTRLIGKGTPVKSRMDNSPTKSFVDVVKQQVFLPSPSLDSPRLSLKSTQQNKIEDKRSSGLDMKPRDNRSVSQPQNRRQNDKHKHHNKL